MMFSCLSAQLALASGVVCALGAGLIRGVSATAVRAMAAAALLVALAVLALSGRGAYGPLIRLDGLGQLWQILFYAGALPAVMLVEASDEVPMALILGGCLGMGLVAVADNLLLAFIGLELLSIPAYLLVAGRGRPDSIEAGLKYFFSGGMAGAIFLMGLALHYAASGDLSLLSAPPGLLADLGQALMGAGALFKIGAVPLHFWLPDVYEASEPALAGFFSTSVKSAGILLLMRVTALAPHAPFARALPAVAALTMLVGALMATRQDDLKRLLAYSSIAHAGNLILGVAAWAFLGMTAEAAAGVFFYLAVYLLMNQGAFAFLQSSGLRRRRDLAGYARRRPAAAALFAIILLSLAGIPPTGGFLAKLLIYWGALQAGAYAALAAAGLSALVALTYYLGLIQAMWFEESTSPAPALAAGMPVAWAGAALAAIAGMAPWVLKPLAAALGI